MGYQYVNIVRRTIVSGLLAIFVSAAFTQDLQEKYINPADPVFRAKYESLVFNDKFVLLAESDNNNNYYIADFSKLKSRFEKIYFLNLVFQSDKIVNMEGNLEEERIWFLADKQYEVNNIFTLFDELKEKTLSASTAYSVEEKNTWLKANDKYK